MNDYDLVLPNYREIKHKEVDPTDFATFLYECTSTYLYPPFQNTYWIEDKYFNVMKENGKPFMANAWNLNNLRLSLHLNIAYVSFVYKYLDGKNTSTFSLGEYPQEMVSQEELDFFKAHLVLNDLKKTGKIYHIPLVLDSKLPPKIYSLTEYFLQGQKYVYLTKENFPFDDLDKPWGTVLFKVSPIKWFLHEGNPCSVMSQKILLGGLPFGYHFNQSYVPYLTSYLKNYMDKEIIPSKIKSQDKTPLERITFVQERLCLLRLKDTSLEEDLNPLITALDKVKEELPKQYKKV